MNSFAHGNFLGQRAWNPQQMNPQQMNQQHMNPMMMAMMNPWSLMGQFQNQNAFGRMGMANHYQV